VGIGRRGGGTEMVGVVKPLLALLPRPCLMDC
jgi:hypothetical protein